MNNIFSWGIIGTGGIAKAFTEDIKRIKNHRVSAVLSRSIKTANAFSSELQYCNCFDDMDLFLNDSNIDAVYVATPNTFHCQQTIKSLNAGIPVLCEKPFSMNRKEAELMVKTSEDNRVALLEGMWMRYLPHINIILKVISEGTIGDIESVSACHGQNLRNSTNPRLWTKELGGGALLDLGIYVVSFVHMVLGIPKDIVAKSVFIDQGVDAKTSMIFKYDNGVIATLNCSMYDSQPNRAIISGSNGYIEVEPTFYAPTSLKVCTNDGEIILYPNKYIGHGLREQALELERCIKNNLIESERMPHNESISVMESMDKIRFLIGLKF
jgi:predicted dehydrogenase